MGEMHFVTSSFPLWQWGQKVYSLGNPGTASSQGPTAQQPAEDVKTSASASKPGIVDLEMSYIYVANAGSVLRCCCDCYSTFSTQVSLHDPGVRKRGRKSLSMFEQPVNKWSSILGVWQRRVFVWWPCCSSTECFVVLLCPVW